MNRIFTPIGLLLASLLLIPSLSFGQASTTPRKVKITITEVDNGVSTTKTDVIDIDENTDVEEILERYGISDQLGNLKEREIVEIEIKRKKKDGQTIEETEFQIEEPIAPLERKIERRAITTPKKPLLGVYFSPESDGAHIESIMSGTAAEKIELQEGDVITYFDGNKISANNDLRQVISNYKSGDKVKIQIKRGTATIEKTVTLGDWKTPEPYNFNREFFDSESFNFEELFNKIPNAPGCSPSNNAFLGISPEISGLTNGVKIARIVSGSTAEELGLQKGDVIKELNGNKIEDFQDLQNALRKSQVGNDVRVNIERNGTQLSAEGTFKGNPNAGSSNIQRFEFHGDDINDAMEELDLNFDEIGKHLEGNEEEIKSQILDAMEQLRDLDFDIDFDFDQSTESSRSIKYKIMIVEVDELSDQDAEKLSISNSNDLKVQDFSFSPNPSDGSFVLSFNPSELGPSLLRILDINGKEVYRDQHNLQGKYSKQIDISNEPAGIYFLSISQGGKEFSKKIVISH